MRTQNTTRHGGDGARSIVSSSSKLASVAQCASSRIDTTRRARAIRRKIVRIAVTASATTSSSDAALFDVTSATRANDGNRRVSGDASSGNAAARSSGGNAAR